MLSKLYRENMIKGRQSSIGLCMFKAFIDVRVKRYF